MSEITLPNVTDYSLVFDVCPEPCALIVGETIVARNRAFRAQFGEVESMRACIDSGDHDKLPQRLDGSRKFVLRPAIGDHAGKRMQWTAWRVDDERFCLRQDGLAGPEIPAALEHFFAEPMSLEAMIAGKMAERLNATTWVIAKDGTILVSEGLGLVQWGVKPGQIVGLNAHQIYPEGTSAREDLVRTIGHGETIRDEMVEGTAHWVRACDPVRDAKGEIVAMVGFAWCASNTAQKLSQARALLAAVAELPVTVWAMEPNGTCTLSVGKGLRHFGLESGQLVGKNLLQVYPPDSTTHADIKRALAGETISHEVIIGNMTWFSTILPMRDALGQKITQIFGVAENVTERSEAQRRMEEHLDLIKSQQEAIEALTSPIIEVWQGVLVVPLIGALDGDRAARLTEQLLAEVVNRQSQAVILDLTGTPMVDPGTAQHLFDIVRSVRLLGAEGLVSGIRPSVAKTMVELDIAGAQWRTFPTLAEALRRIIGKNRIPMESTRLRR